MRLPRSADFKQPDRTSAYTGFFLQNGSMKNGTRRGGEKGTQAQRAGRSAAQRRDALGKRTQKTSPVQLAFWEMSDLLRPRSASVVDRAPIASFTRGVLKVF